MKSPLLQRVALAVARWAGFQGANPGKVQAPATRIGSNPNSVYSNQQRVQLSFEGENAIKNTPFAINYIAKRMMYCSAGMTYAPDTGDHVLDEEVLAYCEQVWKRMGIECSMQEAYGRVADVFLPMRGDSALQWYRDINGLRLLEITGDRIGELYTFTRAIQDVSTGENYLSGLYMLGPDVTAYKIYDRAYDAVYVNPHKVPAKDCIFFKDDIFGGVRGVSAFFAALQTVDSRYQILKSTMDTMQQQSKTAAIVSNNSGGPTEYTYETQVGSQGQVEYVETYADGAVVKYQFNGDSYQVLKAEHPTDTFINGMRYLDENAALAMRFPYSFLFSGSDTGGAPFRGDFEVAGKEIERLRNRVHRPRLEMISYRTIMDAVNRKKLPPRPNIARGTWNFNSLPSADSFRDDKSDQMAVRGGWKTRNDVTRANSGKAYVQVLREQTNEAVMIAKAVQDANRILKAEGYDETVTKADIAQESDNPQQAAQADLLAKGEPAQPSPKIASMSAYIGDTKVSALPESVRTEIAKHSDTDGMVTRYGMTVPELLKKADAHNIETARKNIKYSSNGACAEEVHANADKMILLMNDRIIDGHHFLAKAEKGKVTKSLPVVDLSPLRFQSAA